MYNQYYYPRNRFNRNNRFLGGGFVVPFVLGGITGGLIANNRPNNFYYPNPIFYNNPYNQYYY